MDEVRQGKVLTWNSQIAETYNFSDNALMKLNQTIKNSLDRKGILAPGKNGIWGRTYEREVWRLNKKGGEGVGK